jgi:hypothetical protein
MNKKIIGILIVGMLIVIVFPSINSVNQESYQEKNTIINKSRLFGIGFVRIKEFMHVIKGFVIFGINDGQVLLMEFVNIKYINVNPVLVGYFSPLIFFISYTPA